MTAQQELYKENKELRKKLLKTEEDLRFVVKRLPGLKTIEDLEQDAYLIQELSPEAADRYRRLAGRLGEIRSRFHGPQRGYKRDPGLV
jgi:hypothetical protein